MRPKSLSIFETIKPRPNRRGFLLPDFLSGMRKPLARFTDSTPGTRGDLKPLGTSNGSAGTTPQTYTLGALPLPSALVLKAAGDASHINRRRAVLWQIAIFHPARGAEFALRLQEEFGIFGVALEGRLLHAEGHLVDHAGPAA